MAGRKKCGQKPKLRDPATRKKFLADIRRGLPAKWACQRLGISPETYRNEFRRDPEFLKQFKAAKADRISSLLDINNRHSLDNPKTAEWLLRLYAKEFREADEEQQKVQQHLHVHGTADDPVFMSPEQRRTILISVMGNAPETLESGAKDSVVEAAENPPGNGNTNRADASDSAKVLPPYTVAKANGHAGNGKH